MRTKLTLAVAALALAALAIPALSLAGKNTVDVTAKLKGTNEVPGPGDKNGRGEITLQLKAKKEKICFELELRKLDGAGAAHIHKGTEDVAGKVKVTLFEASPEIAGSGSYEGCVKNVKRKLVKKIGLVPERFYVNVHNSQYPDGAIRGQLEPTDVVRG